MSIGAHNQQRHDYRRIQSISACIVELQIVPPGCRFLCRRIASDPARPAEPLGSGVLLRSTDCIPAVVKIRTIERAARDTETGNPGYS